MLKTSTKSSSFRNFNLTVEYSIKRIYERLLKIEEKKQLATDLMFLPNLLRLISIRNQSITTITTIWCLVQKKKLANHIKIKIDREN